jgi:hypothetical protein
MNVDTSIAMAQTPLMPGLQIQQTQQAHPPRRKAAQSKSTSLMLMEKTRGQRC